MTLTFHPITETVTIGGNKLTVAALPLGTFRRRLEPLMAAFAEKGGIPGGETWDGLLALCARSLELGGHAGITAGAIEEGLTLPDFHRLLKAVLRVSGASEDVPLGEGQAPPKDTGGGSTPRSPRPRAGRSATSKKSSRSPKRGK